MPRETVDSSSIRSIGYSATEAVLQIEFTKSGTYDYLGVPQQAYDALMASASKGQHFNQAIRTRFPYRKVVAGRLA